MIHLLNDRLKSYLFSHRKNQIIQISKDAERSNFFNSILKSRNIKASNQRQILSTIIEAIDIAANTNKDMIPFELEYYNSTMPLDVTNIPAKSSLLNSKSYIGFEYFND